MKFKISKIDMIVFNIKNVDVSILNLIEELSFRYF